MLWPGGHACFCFLSLTSAPAKGPVSEAFGGGGGGRDMMTQRRRCVEMLKAVRWASRRLRMMMQTIWPMMTR